MKRAAVLFLVSGAAIAQDAPPPRPAAAAAGATTLVVEDAAAAHRLFRELDRNGDGYLTSQELWTERGREGNWAAVDRDRDGRISPREFTVLRKP